MDERIRQGYHRIYSELYIIILFLAAASIIANAVFGEKGIREMWLEYMILVGSPIYRLLRIKMLGIAEVQGWNRKIWVRFFCSLTLMLVLIAVVVYLREGSVLMAPLLTFMVPFVLLFFLVAFGTKKLLELWKSQQEKKYHED